MGTAIAMHWSNNAMSMQGSGDLIVSGGGWGAPPYVGPNFAPMNPNFFHTLISYKN